jgi:hypothetical protein
MTAGRLAAAKPAATTNTTLYKCPIEKTASTVLEVCNQSSSASSYRVALRDYDQVLTLDSANYQLTKGNVITNYTIGISPGISTTELDPSDVIQLGDNKGSFKYHDIIKPTATITYPTKVASIDTVSINPSTLVGTFSVGDQVTGDTTGLVATIYQVGTLSLYFGIDPIEAADTSFIVNTDTGITTNDFLCLGGEVTLVTGITGYSVSVTRAQLGTTAGIHLAGIPYTVIRSTATTTTVNEGAPFDSADTVLTVTSSTGLSVGDYIRIGTEILTISSIVGDDLTVSRGSFGTTAATHADAATVTRHSLVISGFAQFFGLTEEIDNGSGATVNLNITASPSGVFNPFDKFVFDFLGTGDFEFSTSIPIDGDRTVRFTQADASNTDNTLRFSLSPDGTNVGGTQYVIGVIINGTAGTSGAYSQIDLDIETLNTNNQIFIYSASTPGITNGGSILVDLTPNYNSILLYDLNGSVNVNDTFSVNNVNYTITSATAGSYGYVMDKTSTSLKVSLGTGSTAFVGTNTFLDSPKTPGEDRVLVTVSSVSTIRDEDYIAYDKAISGNITDRTTGIVVGPGQSVMVYSTANTLSYIAHGFEDGTTDFSPVYYYREVSSAPQ